MSNSVFQSVILQLKDISDRTFGVIDKAPLKVGTGAVLCMAEQFGAFDRDNLIVPVWMI